MINVDQRMETALSMHDHLLLHAPADAAHDTTLCPFCVDWAMTEDGVPAGMGRVEMADATKPYGDTTYADPGYLEDKVKRYPLDTEAHARAAWSYIHQQANADKYTAEQLTNIRVAVQNALKKFGVDAENKELEKTQKMADARNGSNKPSNKPSNETSASTADSQPEVASEGGTHPTMETITTETHEALLEKALRDATASTEAEKAALSIQVAELAETAAKSAEEIAALQAENERLNGELDTAQVALKSASDEAEALKADIAEKAALAEKTKVADERASQVRNLSLFPEEYISDKASRWADMDEAAWVERLDEWKAAKGQAPSGDTTTTSTDTASVVTGSREIPAGQATTARRAALGLV